jgi:hypothetical protein
MILRCDFNFAAHQQRPHPRQQEELCVPVELLLARGETLQGAVHAGGPHAQAHWRKAAQVHGEFAFTNSYVHTPVGQIINTPVMQLFTRAASLCYFFFMCISFLA